MNLNNENEKKLEKFFNKTSEDEKKKSYRNQLIQFLGDKLPMEDKLYATVKELEKMVGEKFGNKNNNNEANDTGGDKRKNGALYKSAKVLRNLDNGIGDFAKNYVDMVDANNRNSDKYFHAKANCEASQRSGFDKGIAKMMSDTRENVELITNRFKKKKDGTKMKSDEILNDYREDQSANRYGRSQGSQNKNTSCKVLVDKYRPNGLNKKY